jgi:hypothetical protein
MTAKIKTVLTAILLAIWLLFLSVLLMLAVEQALRLGSLYSASMASGPASDPTAIAGPRIPFWAYALAAILLSALALAIVWRRPRRLLLTSLLLIVAFGALNLYSGRHLLLQAIVWPMPSPLLEEYAEALAANDLGAALDLTDGSEACNQAVTSVFAAHQAKIQQGLGQDWREKGVWTSPVRRVTTYYEKPVPSGGLLHPVPTQMARLLVRTAERSGVAWLVGLKLRYKPLVGRRYICGEGMDPDGWMYH